MLNKTSFQIELLKEDYTSVFVDLKDVLTIFDGNQIHYKIIKNNEKYAISAEILLAKGYIGYSFIYNFYFDDLIDNSEFFVPSALYGDIHNPSKLLFAKNKSGIGVDGLSAPVISFYNESNGYVLKDLTSGRRETISNDASIEKGTKIIVSDQFNLPGLGILSDSHQIIFQYRYPAHTINCIEEDCNLYRYSFSPCAHFSFELTTRESKSFDDFCKSVWREEFSKREQIQNGIDTDEAIKQLIKYTCRGFGIRNGIPQFCTNTDHYTNESGFLYRNADLAELLLRFKYAGYDIDLSYEQIISVLDIQVENEYAGKNQVWQFSRSRFEGVYAILLAYLLLKEHGIDKDNWWSFVKDEAELCLNDIDYFSVPLLVRLYEVTKDKKYIDSAKHKCDVLWERKISKNNFSGGITDFIGAATLDKETGICALGAFLRLYEVTKDIKYLNYSKKAADYAETYTQLQNINLEPKEYDDTTDYCHLGHGNSHVNSQGLSYVSSTCTIADLANMFGLFDYVKLAEYSGDNHYLEFANYVYLNSFNVAFLDDKTGGMDDYLYNSGYGFAPEYIALASSIDRACCGRGRMHDSTLAWVLYGYLSNGYCFQTNDKYRPHNKLDKRYKIIKVESVDCYSKELLPSNLLVGGRTAFFNAKDNKVILRFKPNTNVDKIVISYHDPSVSCSYLIENVSSSVIRYETQRFHDRGYYDVIELSDNVTTLSITFSAQEDLYICGIIPFGITDNELIKYDIDECETFVSRWIKNDVLFFNGDKQIAFNNKTNTYIDDQIDFLRGGLLHAKDRCGRIKFELGKPHTIFWFRKSVIEKCNGDAVMTLYLNGQILSTLNVKDITAYIRVEGMGQIEIRFDCVGNNSIEYGYLEIKKED